MSTSLPRPSPKLLLNPIHFLSLGFGSGLFPKAPGTAGTLAAVPVYLLISSFDVVIYLAFTFVAFILGIALCEGTSRELGVEDHPAIVWDEIVGFLLTMTVAPAEPIWIVAGFLLFRLFDVLKPWPIRALDRSVKGGFGIMLDDVMAGIFAALVLQFVFGPIIIQ